MQIPIMVDGNTDIEMKKAKELAYNAIFNKYMKTSHRILCAWAYAYIRGCEILDFLFPVKVATNEHIVMEAVSVSAPVWQENNDTGVTAEPLAS